MNQTDFEQVMAVLTEESAIGDNRKRIALRRAAGFIREQMRARDEEYCSNLLQRLERRGCKMDALGGDISVAIDVIRALRRDKTRLLAGDFTKEEIQNFCHKLPETVSRCDFEQGCREYQDKLYGTQSPWRPITEIHEDYGTCILLNRADGSVELGSNLDSGFNESEWTHFALIPETARWPE